MLELLYHYLLLEPLHHELVLELDRLLTLELRERKLVETSDVVVVALVVMSIVSLLSALPHFTSLRSSPLVRVSL